MNWIIVAIVLLMAHREYMASPTPLKLPGHTQKLTPYIRHWEAAHFDRTHLDEAHRKHIEQKRHRRKRDLNSGEYGPAHTIRLNFFAHDREFRLVLRQDPLSVFASDVQIENTEGPMDYDISRIYTGALEDDENSRVHAVLTHDNLLDGTIETASEHYYLEPSHRYSRDLPASGIHSIVYKLSDVDMRRAAATEPTKSSTAEHCASEHLRRSMLRDELKRRKSYDQTFRGYRAEMEHAADNALQSRTQRHKRWLPEDELRASDVRHQDPPLPLDLEVPYNDDYTIFSHQGHRATSTTASTTTTTTTAGTSIDRSRTVAETTTFRSGNYNNNYSNNRNQERTTQQSSVIRWRNGGGGGVGFVGGNRPSSTAATSANVITTTVAAPTTRYTRNRNIIVNNYNPIGDNSNSNSNSNNNNNNYSFSANNNSYNGNNNVRKTYTKHKNIIVSTYNNNNNNNDNNNSNNNNNNNNRFTNYDRVDDFDANNNNFFNTNWTSIFTGNDHRPIHKTHVEIITKNGATKRPNIIVNNYNPDIIVAPNPHTPNLNTMLMTNLLSGRGSDTSPNDAGSVTRSLYDRKITCMLYLQADHTFFQKLGSDEASIEAITRHVQRANSIYKNTDFNNDGKPDNITFMIKRIKVHNMNAVKDPAYRFPGNYGVEKFLELFSEEDYDAFCLAYMFTYRDFEMGTLGLAWTGDLKNAGGVCEKNGHYRGSLKSLNTGIVTLLNYGKHVPPAVSHVTLAHEIGHNFGSPHDPEQCTPGGEDGNYIMFARATSGDKRNNNKFSPCSLKSIEPVLNAKARSPKGCFTEPQSSICGNGVVEPGEQCDCGWEEDCKDSCCFPMSRHPRLDEKPCTLTPRAKCSPSQGPCCTVDCNLKFGDKCRDDNGCRDPSFCDGHMPQCPPSVNKPNKTICNKEFVCYMGECTGSICLAYGLESCQCIPGPKDDKIKSCELCCKLPGEENPCRSSFEWNEPPFDVPDMYAKPGTPCNDYNGYCDVFQKCREVDPSGPLATLRKLLLSEESIATFKKWIQHNWYTVALAAVGVFVLLILSTKLLAKRSNLKLKSVTIIHSATTETVRLPEDNNGVIVHTAVRTKVPFKKKVRGERNISSNKNNNNNNNNNNAGSKANKSAVAGGGKSKKTTTKSSSTAHLHGRGTKVAAAAPTTAAATTTEAAAATVATTPPANSGGELKKPTQTRGKKNRISGTTSAATQNFATNVVNAVVGIEKAKTNSGHESSKKAAKKSKKQNKEIIDYSTRNGLTAGESTGGHMNTFSKVQKWLLESPIVAQPLSHIEHSSKVRKVMSKSQSTPERLVQKPAQKSKSMGNLSSEKVKLQVVYKPPFRFALRLSKSTKIKTHVIGGKLKRPSARNSTDGAAKWKQSSGNSGAVGGHHVDSGGKSLSEKTKRAALLLRSKNDEDNQILTLNEPNYETLNPKTIPSKVENPFYENLHFTEVAKKRNSDPSGMQATGGAVGGSGNAAGVAVKRSSSKSNLDGQPPAQRMSSSDPFNIDYSSKSSRRLSESNDVNLSRNFGSTQNLINTSQGNPAKSKKRSSLNLKSGLTKDGKDPGGGGGGGTHAARRNSSNMNLRRDSANKPFTTAGQQQYPLPLRRNSSSTTHATQSGGLANAAPQQLSHAIPQPTSRASFSNIPRASLSHGGANGGHQSTPNSSGSHSPATANSSLNNFLFGQQATSSHLPHVSHMEHRRSRNSLPLAFAPAPPSVPPPPPPTTTANSAHPQQQRSNSVRQHEHHHHPPPLPAPTAGTSDGTAELPSDLEVMVSDVENLVS